MRTKRNSRSRQVYVEYRDDVDATSPVEGRTYTMTHSDETGDLYVTIGLTYAEDKTNETQDQVYLKWMNIENKYYLYGEVLVDGPGIMGDPQKRNEIFRREMPLALQAIYTADMPLFKAYPTLNETPVLINFQSTNPQYDKLYGYDVMGNYNAVRQKPHRK